jgi:hypothetical protein
VKHEQLCQFETAALLDSTMRARDAFHNVCRALRDAIRALDLD